MQPTMFSKVVLPLPEGPATATNSPRRTDSDTSFSAVNLSLPSTYSLNSLSTFARILPGAHPEGAVRCAAIGLCVLLPRPIRNRICEAHNWAHLHPASKSPVSRLDPNALADLRKTEIGFIFQTFNLIPVLSARENVEYPLLLRGLTRGERRERVEYFLRIVGLERFMDHRPNELSGGQRQRVAIARALGVGPAVVLADEPTANLDHRTGQSILELMYSINEEHGTTFIFSTHDAKVIQMAKRVVKIAFGEIVDAGYQFESP